jgi:2-amino-4-hydroxy-6-hydroxymethyldihydropteridine diphosphokinase
VVNLSFGIVALGANLPLSSQSLWETLKTTLSMLHQHADISICSVSRFWTTPAFPAGSGPDYANAVALVSCKVSAAELLQILHGIEADYGRDRTNGRWSARVLDLDLIAFDDMILPDATHLERWINLPLDQQKTSAPDQLILPHPRLQDRGFVLAPLAEILPQWRHPLTGRSVAQMLADLPDDALAEIIPMPPADLPAFA